MAKKKGNSFFDLRTYVRISSPRARESPIGCASEKGRVRKKYRLLHFASLSDQRGTPLPLLGYFPDD